MEQDEALAIAGPVSMRLNVASTSNTMDWMVKLVDVYPSGEAYNIAEGILRVHQDRAPATDGTQLVDMVGTANVFLPGHSIRVDVRLCLYSACTLQWLTTSRDCTCRVSPQCTVWLLAV